MCQSVFFVGDGAMSKSHNPRILALLAHPFPLPPLPFEGEGEPHITYPPRWGKGQGRGGKPNVAIPLPNIRRDAHFRPGLVGLRCAVQGPVVLLQRR